MSTASTKESYVLMFADQPKMRRVRLLVVLRDQKRRRIANVRAVQPHLEVRISPGSYSLHHYHYRYQWHAS